MPLSTDPACDLVFYTHPMSRGRIARWMLEEIGQPYRQVWMDFGTTAKAPDYLALNPMGKVPTLQHQGQVITECAAICAYLAETFPEAGLSPTPAERADYYRWLLFAAGPVEAAVVDRALGVTVAPKQEGMVGYGNYERTMDTLARAVSAHPWIAGDRFTAADVYVGSQVMWGLQFKSLPERPEFRAYAERLATRPARLAAAAIDDPAAQALMAARAAAAPPAAV